MSNCKCASPWLLVYIWVPGRPDTSGGCDFVLSVVPSPMHPQHLAQGWAFTNCSTHICCMSAWIIIFSGFPGGSDGKESTCNVGDLGFNLWVGKIPWKRERLPTPVFLPREFPGQRSLAGYSPQGHKESDTTERLSLSLLSSIITLNVNGLNVPIRRHRPADWTKKKTRALLTPCCL